MAIIDNDQMTPRESLEHEWRVEEQRILQEHAVTMKRLELQVAKLDVKWATWLRIPLTVVKLPIYIIMSIAYCIAVAKGNELSSKFWEYMR